MNRQFFGRQQACSSRTLPPRFQMSATPQFVVDRSHDLMFELGADDFDTPLRRRLTPDLTGQAFARRLP